MSFLPTSLSNLELWLDAGQGITLNGTNVAVWADQSGNGHNASASASVQPAFVSSAINGLPAISFTSGKLLNDTASAMTNQTVFVVGKIASTATDIYQAMISWGSGASSYEPDFYFQLASVYYLAAQWGASVASYTDLNPGKNIPYLATLRVDATAKQLAARLNGKDAAANPVTATAIATTSTGFTLGTDGPDQYAGHIAEVLVYARRLTDDEVKQVESYLAYKYNVAIPPYLQGSTAAQGTLSAAATVQAPAAGVAAGQAALSASPSVQEAVTGAAAGQAALSASPSVQEAAAGAATGQGTLAGVAIVEQSAAGAAAGQGVLGAAPSVQESASGQATGLGTLTSSPAVQEAGAGEADGQGALSASPAVETLASGVAAGQGSLPGSPAVQEVASGASAGAGVFTGQPTLAVPAAGVAAGVGSATAAATAGTTHAGAGIAAGQGAATATVTLLKQAAGVAAGQGQASASAQATAPAGPVRHLTIGGVVFPLAVPAQGGSLLTTCDPFVAKALDYYQTCLNAYCAVALCAALPGQVQSACAETSPLNPELYLAHITFRTPLLALYPHTAEFREHTQRWDRTDQAYRLDYVLPPLNQQDAQRVYPFLKAAFQLLVLVTENAGDPFYRSNEQVWAAAGLQEIRLQKATFAGFAMERAAGLGLFPSFTAELLVREREGVVAADYPDLGAIDLGVDTYDDEGGDAYSNLVETSYEAA